MSTQNWTVEAIIDGKKESGLFGIGANEQEARARFVQYWSDGGKRRVEILSMRLREYVAPSSQVDGIQTRHVGGADRTRSVV